jgi:hypothetical protein
VSGPRLLLALAVLVSGGAQGAACCLSSSAFGVGRLALWESAAVLVNVSAAPGLGQWNQRWQWVPNAPGASDLELRVSLAAIVALHERVQVSARLPWVLERRTAEGLVDVGQSVGDALLSTRVEALAIGQYAQLPGVAFTVGLVMPSGRPMSATRPVLSPLAADVTGRGAWVLLASTSLEYAVQPWYAQLNLGVSVPLPMAGPAPGVTQRFGPAFEAGLAGGWEPVEGLVLSLVARLTWESALVVGGLPTPDSGALDLGLGPTLSWRFDPHWTLQAGVDTGLFTSALGQNRPGRVAGSAGIRYGFF